MTKSAHPRYHHLDALRAFAMLLGVVLHALLSFFEIPVWPAQDLRQHHAYGTAQHFIHGFRMPLFFLISGFFTAMLWRRRGLGQLVLHRLKRILLPLVVGWFAFVPLTIVVSALGDGAKKSLAERKASAQPETIVVGDTIWMAAATGNTAALERHLRNGVLVDAGDKDGVPPLTWAVMFDQQDCARLLLARGADVNAADGKGNTPLHAAAFFGRPEMTRLLVDEGADVNRISLENNTPLDSAAMDWWIVEMVGGIIKMELKHDQVMSGRAELVDFLESKGAKTRAGLLGIPGWAHGLLQLYQLGAMIPVFFHLWFLYYLLWLIAGFVVVAWIVRKLAWRAPPSWLIASPACFLWLVPLTTLPQFFMHQTFGPDTAVGLLPWPPKFFYYAIFFGFGALCYGRPEFEERGGRRWPILLLLALPVFACGLSLFLERPAHIPQVRILLSLCAALYAWLMIFAFLGFFRRLFARPNKTIRFVSDASYWIYLAHLPLVIGLQVLVMTWPLPALVKFLAICILTYALLLVLYRYLVRYTWIGTMLNGKKGRIPPLPATTEQPAQKVSSSAS